MTSIVIGMLLFAAGMTLLMLAQRLGWRVFTEVNRGLEPNEKPFDHFYWHPAKYIRFYNAYFRVCSDRRPLIYSTLLGVAGQIAFFAALYLMFVRPF